MDIILDTNVIVNDFKFRDKNFEILLDYLDKTNSKLIYPSIVLEEIKGKYKSKLIEKHESYSKCLSDINHLMTSTDFPENDNINIESETKNYLKYLHTTLKTSSQNIIKYKDSYLPEIVRRAIERIKPIDSKGQQFRDCLLWLTLLDYASQTDEQNIVFISDNVRDFAEKGSNRLNKDLQKEADARGVEINYFRSLSDFVRGHTSTIDFITDVWLNHNLDTEKINSLFIKELEEFDNKSILETIPLDTNEFFTGYIQRTDYLSSKYIKFYDYIKADGESVLNIEWEFGVEYEVETGKSKLKTDSSHPTGHGIDHAFDLRFELPIFKAMYVVSLKDEKLIDYQLKSIDIE